MLRRSGAETVLRVFLVCKELRHDCRDAADSDADKCDLHAVVQCEICGGCHCYCPKECCDSATNVAVADGEGEADTLGDARNQAELDGRLEWEPAIAFVGDQDNDDVGREAHEPADACEAVTEGIIFGHNNVLLSKCVWCD